MDSTELERRVRLKYEWTRVCRAVAGLAPAVVIVLAAVLLAQRPRWALVLGVSALVAGAWMLWYGRSVGRAVLPGVLAGLVPLALSLCANRLGGPCSVDGCTGLCMAACSIGGLSAGLAVAAFGIRRRLGDGFWIAASGLTLLTGAMGCACVGHMGLLGLVLGYTVGLAPRLVHAFSGRRVS